MWQFLTHAGWVERAGWMLVHSLWQFALVALLALMVHRALRHRSAAMRYQALLGAMLLLVAMPLATWFWLGPVGGPAAALETSPPRTLQPARPPRAMPAAEQRPLAPSGEAAPAEPTGQPAARPPAEPDRLQLGQRRFGWVLSAVQQRVHPWLPAIVLLWLAGVFLAALRPLWGWRTARRLRTVGVAPVPDAIGAMLQRTVRRLKLDRAVELLQSALVQSPAVVGYFRPVILLPLCVVSGLPEAQLELILTHELAHVRRHDYLVNLLQTLVETLFFYHPAVWWLSAQIRNERENCCDDVAMAIAGSRADYGRALLAVAELRAAPAGLSLAAGGGSLVARIRRIGGCEPAPRVVVGGSVLSVILVSVAIFAAVTWAKAPAAEKPEQATAQTVVAGKVVDSTGRPMSGAQVGVVARSKKPLAGGDLYQPGSGLKVLGAAKTDSQGRFRIPVQALSSAAFWEAHVLAAASGYAPAAQPLGLDHEKFDTLVSLAAEQVLRGRVVDSKGQPAANARMIVLWREDWVAETTPMTGWPEPVTTDDQGRFTIHGVNTDQGAHVKVADEQFARWHFYIGRPGTGMTAAEVRKKYPYVFVGDEFVAQKDPAEEVTLVPPASQIIEGRVVYDDSKKPVPFARLNVDAGALEAGSWATTYGQADAEGRFRINPYPGNYFHVKAYPPNGQPYLVVEKRIAWRKADSKRKIEIALPRDHAILVRGKIVETPSGKPVSGASIQYETASHVPEGIVGKFLAALGQDIPNSRVAEGIVTGWQGAVLSGADGVFQIAVPPGHGVLVVYGPTKDYIYQSSGTWTFKTWGTRHYFHGALSLDLQAGAAPPEPTISIRRGVTIAGRLVDPAGRPVAEAMMLSRLCVSNDVAGFRGFPTVVREGRFELHGLDPKTSTPMYFLDAKNQLGAVAEISGTSADGQPVVVHLSPCGKAVARFVKPDGKPLAKHNPDLQIVVTPGPFPGDQKRYRKELSSDQDFVANFDREHYGNEPVTDEGGRCTFPALIPGATYRIHLMSKSGDWDEKDFTVKSGETLQLPDIVIREPGTTAPAGVGAKAKSSAPANAADADAWKPGQTFDVRIINAQTKAPLPGVKVEFNCWGNGLNNKDKVQTTDAQGRAELRLSDRKPEALWIQLSKDHFVPVSIQWRSTPAPPAVPTTLTMPLEPGTVMGGIVHNEKGAAIPGVAVTVDYQDDLANDIPGHPYLGARVKAQTKTDSQGRWWLDIMPGRIDFAGNLRIFLVHPDYISDHLRPSVTPMPLVPTPPVETLRAQTAVMVMRKGATVEGRVIDAAGQPIATAQIYTDDWPWSGPARPAATAGKDGRFRVDNLAFAQSGMNDPPRSILRAVEARQMPLVVVARGYSPELVEADTTKPTSGLEITLRPGLAVVGQVVDERGKPLAGGSVWLSNWLGYRDRLRLQAKTDADGKFRLADVPAGRVLYFIEKNGYSTLQDFPLTAQPPGQAAGPGHRITLKAPLRVAGAIVDAATGRPLARCKVIMGGDYDDGRAPYWWSFREKMITNGQYQVEFSDSQDRCYRIRVEAEGYLPAESRMFKLDAPDKGRVTYDFRLEKAPPLTGTVLGLDGQPLAGAQVFLATQSLTVEDGKALVYSGSGNRATRSNAAGRFQFAPEVEPFYLVVLAPQGYAVLTEKQFAETPAVRIQAWKAGNHKFLADRRPVTRPFAPRNHPYESAAAEAQPGLLVRVVDPQGQPVEGAHVGASAELRVSPNAFVPYDSGWDYFPHVLSDRDGRARVADPAGINCIVARHHERRLVAFQAVSPGQAPGKGPLTLVMQPQCTIHGTLTAKELEARGRKLDWSTVYLYLAEGFARPMSCQSNQADFHLYAPPGTYKLDAYGGETQHVEQTITVQPGQRELEVEPIDLPPRKLVLLEGQPAPELRDFVAWKNGGPLKLADLRGKVVILALSPTWNGQSEANLIPYLVPAYEKYRDRGLVIIDIRDELGFDIESAAQLDRKVAAVKKPYWKDRDLPLPIALGLLNSRFKGQPVCQVEQDYGCHRPGAVLIDREERVVGGFDPRRSSDDELLKRLIEERAPQTPQGRSSDGGMPPVARAPQSVPDGEGRDVAKQVVGDDPLARPPLPPALQAQGREILRKMAEANRYWLDRPPPEVRNYRYTFRLGEKKSRTFKDSDRVHLGDAVRQGIGYQSALKDMTAHPENVDFRQIDVRGDKIILTVTVNKGLLAFAGYGGPGAGTLDADVHEGTLIVDPRTYVPEEFRSGEQWSEQFSDYAEVRPNHLVPLRVRVHCPVAFDFRFRVYEPGLWLFASTESEDLSVRPQVDDVIVNGTSGKVIHGPAGTSSASPPATPSDDELAFRKALARLKVAEAELEKKQEANRKVPGSVPAAEMKRRESARDAAAVEVQHCEKRIKEQPRSAPAPKALPSAAPSKAETAAPADVPEKVRSATWEVASDAQGAMLSKMKYFFLVPSYYRIEMTLKTLVGRQESVSIIDGQTGKSLYLDLQNKVISSDEGQPFKNSPEEIIYSLQEQFRNFQKANREASGALRSDEEFVSQGQREIDGQMAVGFGVRKGTQKMIIWADRNTARPVRFEAVQSGPPLVRELGSNFRYNVDLDPALFSLDVPAALTKAIDDGLVELLRYTAADNQGVFPPEILGDKCQPTVHAAEEQELESLPQVRKLRETLKGGHLADESFSMDAWTEEYTKIAVSLARHQAVKHVSSVMFCGGLKPQNDAHYAGKDVKLGTPDRPVLWYKPAPWDKYHVIYADLSVKVRGRKTWGGFRPPNRSVAWPPIRQANLVLGAADAGPKGVFRQF